MLQTVFLSPIIAHDFSEHNGPVLVGLPDILFHVLLPQSLDVFIEVQIKPSSKDSPRIGVYIGSFTLAHRIGTIASLLRSVFFRVHYEHVAVNCARKSP
jgi:hypothetical protein